MVRNISILLALVATLAASPAHAQPAKKAKPACGISWLPLAEGSEWTYASTTSPDPISDEEQAQLDKAQRSAPRPAAKIVIKVVKVEDSGAGAAQVTLDENIDGQALQTTIKCSKDAVDISPQSFFFSGEPGGGLRMTLENVTSTGVGYPGVAGFAAKAKNKLTLRADVKREPSPGTGAVMPAAKLELELDLRTVGLSQISTDAGVFKRVSEIEMEVSGRAAVEPALDKTFEIPLGIKGKAWFAPGVGLVRIKNRLGHWYDLVDFH